MTAAPPGSPDYRPPAPGTAEHRRLNLGFIAMVVGMFMAILDIQIVASSIAQIQAGVSASADEVAWIQTSYLIAEVIGIPLSGLFNRALGMRRLFIVSALGFIVASILCALSWNLTSLIIFRCLQGFLGSAMIPTAMAAAFTLFGANRSMLQQVTIGLVATLAPSIGPTLGGFITDWLGWRWLFLINVPPGILAAWAVWRLIPGAPKRLDIIRSIDLTGLIAMAVFLGAFEWTFEEAPRAGWFDDMAVATTALVCALAGTVFFHRALTRPNPVVDLSIFTDRNFALGSLTASVVGLGLFGAVYLTPLFLGGVRGYSSLQIGQIMSIGGLAMFAAGPVGGALIRKYDARLVLAAGLLLAASGLFLNAFMSPQTAFGDLILPQALRGAGLILCLTSTNFLALGTLPPQKLPNAAGLITVCRNLGGAVGLAALNTLHMGYAAMHRQELAAGLSPERPAVDAHLAAAARWLAARGVSEPERAAMALLSRDLEREAMTMSFNNLFLVISVCFVVMALLTPLLRRTAPAGR
jgi:DHA2 family multidrug resistance protein